MAIINSYPLATPKLTDLILGTSTSSNGQTATKSFTVESIKNTTIGVQTIITTIPATLNITGSGTANVTINTVTAAITSGGAALATGGDIYTFLTGKITGTPNTVPIWTDATTLGDSLISQANNSVIINGSGTDGRIQLNCSATTHGVGIQSPPHSASATYNWVLPQSTGIVGQTLTSGGGTTDQLTWTTPTPGKEYSLANQQNGSGVDLDLSSTGGSGFFLNGFNPSSSNYYATTDPSLFISFGASSPLNSTYATLNDGGYTTWVGFGDLQATFNIGGTSYGPYTYTYSSGSMGQTSVPSSTFRVNPATTGQPLNRAYQYQFSAYADGGSSDLRTILINFNSTTDSLTLTKTAASGSSTVTVNAAGGISLTSNSNSAFTISSTNAAGTVTSVTSADTNTLTVANTTTTPAITAVTTGGVGPGKNNLATGDQIQTAIDSALAGALTFKGTFNATTGQIVSGSNNGSYLYNCPGGAGTRVAISVGDLYIVSTAGSFYCTGSSLSVADEVIATADAAADSSVVGNWSVVPSASGGITGGGTVSKVPLWTGTTVLGDSAIAQSGTNVGIGVSGTSISSKLTVKTTGTAAETVAQFGNSNISEGLRIITSDGDLEWGLGTPNSRNLVFQTFQNERMRITGSGNVGIGTTNPVLKTQISTPLSAGSVQDVLLLSQNTSSYGNTGQGVKMCLSSYNSASRAAAIGAIAGSGNDHSLVFYTNSTANPPAERMRIDSSGNVGIGTLTPSVSLDINTTDAVQMPAGTTTERNAITSPANGMFRYNTTDNQFEGYADGAWGAIAGGGGGGGTKTVATVASVAAGVSTHALGVSVTTTPTVNYVDLYISGVYQSKTSYTVSGNTLTLTGATFPTGALIETVTTT